MPIVAMAAFAGDQAALSEAVFGNPATPDPRPQAIGNLDRIVAEAIRRSGGTPTFVAIENFGRADAGVTTFHEPPAGDVEPMTLTYHGATGAFDKVKPIYGTRPSAGGTVAAIMGPLHFGNFAGLLSKAVWFGLGFAMCYVTLTGLRLWLVRRREAARSLGWLERSASVVGFGLPLGLVVAAAAFFVTMPLGSAVWWTPAAFLIASAAAIVAGFAMRSVAQIDSALQSGMAALMLMIPLIRLACGGPGWEAALAAGQPIIMAVDLAMALGGGWMLWAPFGARLRSVDTPVRQPAE